jgi:hypothetical protein
MGSRKSITLTSPERLNKVSEQANKHEAISTHQGLATPAGEILLLVGAGERRRQAILRSTHEGIFSTARGPEDTRLSNYFKQGGSRWRRRTLLK